MQQKYIDKFWSRVDKSQGTDGCWTWTAGKFQRGYGCMTMNNKSYETHRLSWQMHYGQIPDGIQVCHHCDNPSCVNPAHLFLGSIADNMVDKTRKGRQARGSRHANAKLTEAQVLEIRDLRSKGMTITALAKKYGVDHTLISYIVLRKGWTHI